MDNKRKELLDEIEKVLQKAAALRWLMEHNTELAEGLSKKELEVECVNFAFKSGMSRDEFETLQSKELQRFSKNIPMSEQERLNQIEQMAAEDAAIAWLKQHNISFPCKAIELEFDWIDHAWRSGMTEQEFFKLKDEALKTIAKQAASGEFHHLGGFKLSSMPSLPAGTLSN